MFGFLKKLRNRRSFLLLSIPSGVIFLASGVYLWRTHDKPSVERHGILRIKDNEFSGMKLVKVPEPFSSAHDPPKWCLSEDMLKRAEDARNRFAGRLHPNDVFVASYPKSGTTWLSEIVYLLVTKQNYKDALRYNLEERVPFMEYIWPGAESIIRKPAPRIIKTHLSFPFLPEEVQSGKAARIVYIVRDPRDVVVSYYHFVRCFTPAGYKNREKLTGFVRRFIEDRLPYSPWDEHVQSYLRPAANWAVSKTSDVSFQPRVLLVRYEALKSDPVGTIRRIESFLLDTWTSGEGPHQKPARLTEAEMQALVHHCSFSQMSKNPMANFSWFKELGLWSCKEESSAFLRRGVVGDHASFLSGDEIDLLTMRAEKSGLDWTLREQV